MLADWQIEKACAVSRLITPFNPGHIQPASYDLTLSPVYRRASWSQVGRELDCKEITPNHTELYDALTDGHGYIAMKPGDFILAQSCEEIRVPNTLAARVEGKSSLGRIGLAVHITAGFIDPGFIGQITLEIANMGPWLIKLRPPQKIAQIAFFEMAGLPRKSYAQTGHYQNQVGPTESRFRM